MVHADIKMHGMGSFRRTLKNPYTFMLILLAWALIHSIVKQLNRVGFNKQSN